MSEVPPHDHGVELPALSAMQCAEADAPCPFDATREDVACEHERMRRSAPGGVRRRGVADRFKSRTYIHLKLLFEAAA